MLPAGDLLADRIDIRHKRRGTGIADHPIAIFILCPVGNGIPSRWLIPLDDTFIDADLRILLSDLAHRLCGRVFFRFDQRDLFRRAHIYVRVLKTIVFLKGCKKVPVVAPVVRHSDGVKPAD